MTSNENSGGCVVCCFLLLILYAIGYLLNNWNTIAPTLFRISYWIVILSFLGIILYELYWISDKFSQSYSNICAIFFAGALISLVLFSGLSLSPGQQVTPSVTSNPQTVSPTPTKSISSTPIKTITSLKTPVTLRTTIKSSTRAVTTTLRGINVPTTFVPLDPAIYKAGVIEYATPVLILNSEDLQIGDMIQMAPTDSRYDKNHAFFIENKFPSSSNPYLIKEIMKFDNDNRWVVISGQSSRTITGGALKRDYPYKIGHSSIEFPKKCRVCPPSNPNCAEKDKRFEDC